MQPSNQPYEMKEVQESVDPSSPKSLTNSKRDNPGHRLYERGMQKNQLKEMFI